jgi:DNA polymerase-3 subunit beta
MKVHVPTNTLAETLAHVERVIPARSSNPGLSYLRIALKNDQLTFSGTNMEIDIEARLTADVQGEGTFALPSQVFGQVVRALPGETVELEFGEREVRIVSGNYDTKLQLVDPDQAPLLTFPEEFSGSLRSAELARVLSSVRYSAATNDYQAIFRGIKLELAEGHTRAIGSDGFRLAYYHTDADSGIQADVIVPARSVDEIIRILDEGETNLQLGDGQLSLSSGAYRLNVKLMEGTFPDYNRVIPHDFPIDIIVSAAKLQEAVSRVSVLADPATNNRIDLIIDNGVVNITAEGAYGGAQESVEVVQEGNESQIALAYNAKYLSEAIKPLAGELRLRFSGAITPSLVYGITDPGYLAMIVPLKTVTD